MKIEFSEREEGKYFVSEMFNFVIVTFIDGSLGEVSIKSTVANRNSSQENCTNSLKPNSKFYILNLTYTILQCIGRFFNLYGIIVYYAVYSIL